MIILNVEQRSEAWFQARLGRITASQFSVAMSGETTKGYNDLLLNTAGEIISGQVEESYSNAIMERGIELEPFARQEYNEMFGEVEEVGFCIPDESNELHEWVGVSPDGMNGGILEIKCPLIKTHLGYIKANKLPNDYKWQVQGQLMVTEKPYCDFMSYYPNVKPFIIRVLPDHDMIDRLTERLKISIERIKVILSDYKKYDYEN